VNIVFLQLRTISHGFKRIRLDLSHNPSSFGICPELKHVRSGVMALGIPFMEETGRKAVQNGGRSTSKNDHGFWNLFVTFERKNLLLLHLTSNPSFFYSFKLQIKYDS